MMWGWLVAKVSFKLHGVYGVHFNLHGMLKYHQIIFPATRSISVRRDGSTLPLTAPLLDIRWLLAGVKVLIFCAAKHLFRADV